MGESVTIFIAKIPFWVINKYKAGGKERNEALGQGISLCLPTMEVMEEEMVAWSGVIKIISLF